MIALVVHLELAPSHEAAFDELMRTTLDGIRALEPGTLVYALTADPARPAIRILLEVYRDEAAFRAHEAQPHVGAFLDARGALLARPAEVDWLEVRDLATGPAA
ncbi:MAG: hypothetical protein A2V85_07420 [Chloroflexi bacterium RBG_16_72_14]|nr:MAG: hypothetical protein A2V85_07420 [Chloroflexi bacterium RBG_16_72_14]